MKLTKLTTALAALTAAAVLTTSASAQVNVNYSSGDLLIGFEQQTGTGTSANDYVVDLGSVSQILHASSALTFQLSTADLTSAFSSSWASNSATSLVQWGLVANDQSSALGGDGNTYWVSRGEPLVGTKSTSPTRGSAIGQQNSSNPIQNLETGSGGFATTLSTSDTTNAIIESKSGANSWSSFSPSSGTGFNLSAGVEQSLTGDTGPTNSVLDFYEVDTRTASGQPATLLGTFSLSSSGLLTFDPAAVPEPSAYALGFTALILFGVLKRRRDVQA